MFPSISIIICTWNRATSLEATLHSLHKQLDCDNLSVEVIVVDNNSTDRTKSIVNSFRQGWQIGQLRYVFESRQGKQFALNRGIAISNYEVLAFTDDDVLLPTDWLANVARAFTDPYLELAGGRTLPIWPSSGPPPWFNSSMSAVVGIVDLGEQRLCPAPDGYAPAGANLVARRTLFDRVGVFSETHFRHMDFEFGRRCAAAGTVIAYEPSLIVYAPVSEACFTKRYFRRWWFKAGIADDDRTADAQGPLPPPWVFRRFLEDAAGALITRPFGSNRSFALELRAWHSLGMIMSRWRRWRCPLSYPEWVAKYSQKTNDRY